MKNFVFAIPMMALASMPVFALDLLVIDDFIAPHGVTLSAAATVSGGSVKNPTVNALGVERDLWVKKTAGAQGPAIDAQINPFGKNLLRFDQGAGVRGSARITWDGIDGNPDAIAYTGLGGVDLGLVGAGFFQIKVAFNNTAGPVDFVVYDFGDPTGTKRAAGTIALPGGIDLDPTVDPLLTFNLPFASMTLQGGATADMFRSVGAITMTINAEAAGQGGRDVNLDQVVAYIDVPQPIDVPPSLALMGLGLGLLGLRRR
jgi:uncharacterized protein (TIGR03382 family)